MARILYLDLFSGASGDMLLGLLLDLGLSLEELRAALGKLRLDGYQVDAERLASHGIAGTRLSVRDDLSRHPARHFTEVRRIIEASGLSDRPKASAVSIFARIARVEAAIHGVPVEKVHFHEIGAVDSLVDIVGFVAGLELLAIDRTYCSELPTGSGTVQTAHGLLPVPAPATAALLAEVRAPIRPHPAQAEILTPTAAAIIAELARFEQPAMRLERVGYGVGWKELPWPNVVRGLLGEPQPLEDSQSPDESGGDATPQTVVTIECNIDDATGESLGFAQERLLADGALDAWLSPIQMKKGRPGVLLSALARPADAARLADLILRETTTLGVRLSSPLHRMLAGRRTRAVRTPWGEVRVKEKLIDGAIVSISPEHEDCAAIARDRGLTLAQVRAAALEAARSTALPP